MNIKNGDNNDDELMRQTYENINEQIQRLSLKCDVIQKQK